VIKIIRDPTKFPGNCQMSF